MACIMLKRSMHFSCVCVCCEKHCFGAAAQGGASEAALAKLLRPIWVPCYAIMIMMKGLTRIVRGLVG